MINDDSTDIAYAKACLAILENATMLDPAIIDEQFIKTGNTYYPDFDGPKNLMLQEVHTGAQYGKLNPEDEYAYDEEAAARYRTVLQDYLAGRYYPTYYSLSGAYGTAAHGYSWSVRIKEHDWIIKSGNDDITAVLRKLVEQIAHSGDSKKDLACLRELLPESINDMRCTSTSLGELLG